MLKALAMLLFLVTCPMEAFSAVGAVGHERAGDGGLGLLSETQRRALEGFLRAVDGGDVDALEQYLEFEHPLERDASKRYLNKWLKKRQDEKIPRVAELIGSGSLSDGVIFTCLCLRTREEDTVNIVPLVFRQVESSWRTEIFWDFKRGETVSYNKLPEVSVEEESSRLRQAKRFERRCAAEWAIDVRFNPMPVDVRLLFCKASMRTKEEAMNRYFRGPSSPLASGATSEGPDVGLTLLREITECPAEKAAELIRQHVEADLVPRADDFSAAFYLEAAPGRDSLRILPSAGPRVIALERFPVLLDEHVWECLARGQNGQGTDHLEFRLTRYGSSVYGEVKKRYPRTRLFLVSSGRVAGEVSSGKQSGGEKCVLHVAMPSDAAGRLQGCISTYKKGIEFYLKCETQPPAGNAGESRASEPQRR